MNFKEIFFTQLWKQENSKVFEEWIYNSESTIFEQTVGAESYLKIISEGFSKMTIAKMRKAIFDSLSPDIQDEFKSFLSQRQKAIKAICIKTESLDYDCKTNRNWDLTVGQEYFVLGIFVDLAKSCHKISFQILDISRSNTPYFIPAELFEILDKVIPENCTLTIKNDSLSIEPFEFNDKNYIPVEYSFWEDYFDDHKKAVDIYNSTLTRLEIKNDFD